MKRALILLLTVFGIGEAAAAPTYSVMGVREGDTLALRAGPNPDAAKVADIPRDANNLIPTGKTSANGDWAEIRYDGHRGWASAKYLAYGEADAMQIPVRLQCAGTEPFWSITLTPGRMNADLSFLERSYKQPISRVSAAMNHNDIWIVKSPSGNKSISLIVRQEKCSDGMSDREYPFSGLALVPGSDIIAGCCAASGAQ
jgi:uncharacterized membrane protein